MIGYAITKQGSVQQSGMKLSPPDEKAGWTVHSWHPDPGVSGGVVVLWQREIDFYSSDPKERG